MIKVKSGAIVKEITEGALNWFLMAGWEVLEEEKNETNTKEIITSSMPNKEI